MEPYYFLVSAVNADGVTNVRVEGKAIPIAKKTEDKPVKKPPHKPTEKIPADKEIPINLLPPAKLSLIGPGTISDGACTSYKIQTQDTKSVESPVTSNLIVNLSAPDITSFYSTDTCTTPTSTVTIATNESEVAVFYKSNYAMKDTTLYANADDLSLTGGTKIINSNVSIVEFGKSMSILNTIKLSSGAWMAWGQDLNNDYNSRGGTWGVSGRLSSFYPIPFDFGVPSQNIIKFGTNISLSCALMLNGTIYCSGGNELGQLGVGNTTQSSVSVEVIGISTASQIAVNYLAACALLDSGSIKCWGFGVNGRLGSGSTADSSSPVLVTDISTATDIAMGNGYGCALLSDSTVKCWGANDQGQLGNGNNTDQNSPVAVSDITTAISISPGGTANSCALLSGGSVKCWGTNAAGMLGNNDPDTTSSNIPVSVAGISNATELSCGTDHCCVLLIDNTVKCWGNNFSLQSNPSSADTPTYAPAIIEGITTATSVYAGAYMSCAILSNGSAKCWGARYNFNTLGDGTWSPDGAASPVEVKYTYSEATSLDFMLGVTGLNYTSLTTSWASYPASAYGSCFKFPIYGSSSTGPGIFSNPSTFTITSSENVHQPSGSSFDFYGDSSCNTPINADSDHTRIDSVRNGTHVDMYYKNLSGDGSHTFNVISDLGLSSPTFELLDPC